MRYLALNMQGLTGGPIGSIGMLGPSQLAQYNQSWEALLRPIVAALSETLLAPAASRDFAMLLIVWVIALILLVVFWLMVRSPWGRMMRAIREDEDAAAAVGKNVFRAKLQVLILGALLGGLAGLLLAWQIGIITPDDYQPTFTFYAYLILILGGTTRIWAIPVGALLFGLLYSGTRFLNFYPLSLFDSGDRAYLRLILVGLLLILLMAIRPQGSWATAGSCCCDDGGADPVDRRGQQAVRWGRRRQRGVVRRRVGSITGLIGPNGAGKTTMFNLISGFLRPEVGAIHFDGWPVDGRSPALAAAGLVRTFQSRGC